MMPFALVPRALALVAAGMLAGCGGGAPAAARQGCPALAVPPPPLVAPALGSTGIPVTQAVLTFGPIEGSSGGLITGKVTLTAGDGSSITSGPFVANANGMSETVSIGTLHARTTYEVIVSGNVVDQDCSVPFGGADGSFTTE